MFKTMEGRAGFIRTADGAFIPENDGNADYQAALAWVSAGNVPEEILLPVMTYRQKRARAYIGNNAVPGLGKEVGEICTIGDVLDVLIAEVYARGAPATPEFGDLLSKIAVIKAAYPKPAE